MIITNIARAVGFNKPHVERFYEIYRELIERHEYEPSRIWNMDETGITCVHRPGKILASKGPGSQAGSQNHKWGTRQDSNCHLCHERSRHLPSAAVHLPAKAHGQSADEWRSTPVNRSCQSQWVDGFGDLHRLAEAFCEVHKFLHNQSGPNCDSDDD